MDIIRKYKKNDWWDFCLVIEQELARRNEAKTYIDLLDELHWRKVECISEGGDFKIKNKARELSDRFLQFCMIHPTAQDEIDQFNNVLMSIFS